MNELTRSGLAAAALVASLSAPAAGAAECYRLEELRAIARARHPSLESAQAAIDDAVAFRLERRLFTDPTARFEGGRAESGQESGSEWQVELGQRLPLPGARRWRLRQAAADLEGSQHRELAVRALVDYEVGRLWLEALLAERAAEVAAQSEAISRRLLELLERRVEAGESAPLEALQARSEWFARRKLASEAGLEVEVAKAALDIFCQRVLGRDFELAGELDSPRELPPLETLLARLTAGHPALLAQRASVAASEAERNAERRSALPDIELSLSRESELDKDATTAGLALLVPLWNRNRGAIASAEASLRAMSAELDALRLDLELELERAVLAYKAAAEAIALYDEGWRAAALGAVEIAGFSFENGESSLLELLDAQRSYLSVGLAEAEARARLTLSRLRLEQLLNASLFEVETDESN